MTHTPDVPDSLGDVTQIEEFVATPDGLRTVLALIDTVGPEGWQMLPAARVLLDVAERRFRPLARAWHRPVEDATHAAWMAMRTRSVRVAADPWAVITRVVELAMQAETYGERLLISPDKARRPGYSPTDTPVRVGEHAHIFFDVAGNESAPDGNEQSGDVVEVVAAFLVIAGWSDTTSQCAVEYIAGRIADLGSIPAALDGLRRDHAARLRLGLDQEAWNKLLSLLIGPQPDDMQPSELGVFARVLSGDDLSDLLRDTALLARARETVTGTRR